MPTCVAKACAVCPFLVWGGRGAVGSKSKQMSKEAMKQMLVTGS